jgi:hypothetical protein
VDVLRTEIARDIEEDRIDHHAIARSGGLEEPGCDSVAKTAAAEVDTDPDAVLLVGEDVDVVVAAADGAELRVRLVLQRLRGFGVPALVRIADEG